MQNQELLKHYARIRKLSAQGVLAHDFEAVALPGASVLEESDGSLAELFGGAEKHALLVKVPCDGVKVFFLVICELDHRYSDKKPGIKSGASMKVSAYSHSCCAIHSRED